jgi:hypothetical protein
MHIMVEEFSSTQIRFFVYLDFTLANMSLIFLFFFIKIVKSMIVLHHIVWSHLMM